MLNAWLIFPILMLLVCTGCGLLLDALAGWRVPPTLVPLSGLALATVGLSFTTNWQSIAEASTPLLCVMAGAGWVLGHGRLRQTRRANFEGWGIVVALAAFACFALPVIATGNATFLGYNILNDSSFNLGLANLLVGHGPNLNDVQYSGYTVMMDSYISTGYPAGADIMVGALSRILAENVAWNFQPFMAVALTLGAVGLYELLRDVVSSPRLRIACALLAACNGLVFSLYGVASIKELVLTAMLTLVTCLVVCAASDARPRHLLTLAIAVAATLDIIGITGVPWLGFPLAALAVVLAWRLAPRLREMSATARSRALGTTLRRQGRSVLIVVPLLVVAAIPIIAKAPTFFAVSKSVLSTSSQTNAGSALGFLIRPLDRLQIFGIWPEDDFRLSLTSHLTVTHALIGLEILSGALAILWMIYRRHWGPLVLLAGTAVSAAYLLHVATPYAASKVLGIASVAVVLTGGLGAAALHDLRHRDLAWVLIAVLGAGVLWTDGLAYRYESVAPAGQLHELAEIDKKFSGRGPALYPYGAEGPSIYLLHNLAPIAPAYPSITPRPGLQTTGYALNNLRWDSTDLDQSFVQSFNLIVEDGSPAFSRPPADFTLAWRGRYFNVWERQKQPKVISHIGFGTYPYGSAVPSCRLIKQTAASAIRRHAQLAYVLAPDTTTFIPARAHPPGNWVPLEGDQDELTTELGLGTLNGHLTIKRSGTYQVWLDGSIGQRFVISINGREVGSIGDQIGPLQQATRIGTVTLSAGRHSVSLVRPTPGALVPGRDDAGEYNRFIGALMLVRNGVNDTVSTIAPDRAQSLCGRSLEWLEVVSG